MADAQLQTEPKKYLIECHQGAPLSSWFDPATEEEILDRYYEQYLDFADEEDNLKRENFTRELFEDLWDCELVEV